MKPYNFLQINKFKIGEHYITPLREQDIFKIKDWRNSQFDILRQKNKLTNEDQIRYYQDVVKPTFSYPKPLQMLFSFLLNDECIGYGGLTNIDWESKRGELSFLLDPIRADNHALYEKEFSRFLDLMKQLVFEGLQFNRIFTETYDIRPFHISILEKNGFTPEGRLREHVLINRSFVDSLFHGFIKENYVAI